MSQIIERYHFIHNVFASFFKDLLDFFADCLYPTFQWKVIGTYDKAVEYIKKQCELEREADKPLLPAIVLNPSGEFLPAETSSGGRQFWRYPNLSPTFVKRIFDPIYQDENLIVSVGFIRIKGDVEIILLLNSFYEYCDLRMMMINVFGGLERIIYPKYFSSFIILPEDFLSYTYENEYRPGLSYRIDWDNIGAYEYLVPTTNRNELVVPVTIRPILSLTNLGDSSERYGGSDRFAEWKLSATINYEIELPNFLVIESDYLVENINLEIRYGSAYSFYNDYQPPTDRMITVSKTLWDFGTTPHDSTSFVDFQGDYSYSHRYFHIITQAEAALCDSTSDIEIIIPEDIDDTKMIIVNSKYGQLNYGDHYILRDPRTLVIRTSKRTKPTINTCQPQFSEESVICLEEGSVLEIFVYKRIT